MEKTGVIRKADEPTEWVSLVVVVEKPNGELRMSVSKGPKQRNQKRVLPVSNI